MFNCVAERIKEQRKVLGLTQPKLAERIGVSIITIKRWEHEERMPNVSIMPKLAEALGTSVAYLMGLEDEPTKKEATPHPEPVREKPVLSRAEEYEKGIAVMIDKSGTRYEVPATPEGYAFLRGISDRDARVSSSAGEEDMK